MNKWLKNLFLVLAIFSFSYYLILAIVDGYFLGMTLLWVVIGIICVGLIVLDSKGKFPKLNKFISAFNNLEETLKIKIAKIAEFS